MLVTDDWTTADQTQVQSIRKPALSIWNLNQESEKKEPLCIGCPSVSMQIGYTLTELKIATEVSFSNSHHRMVNRFYVAAATQGHRLFGQTSFKFCHRLTKGYSDILEDFTQEISTTQPGSDTVFLLTVHWPKILTSPWLLPS